MLDLYVIYKNKPASTFDLDEDKQQGWGITAIGCVFHLKNGQELLIHPAGVVSMTLTKDGTKDTFPQSHKEDIYASNQTRTS